MVSQTWNVNKTKQQMKNLILLQEKETVLVILFCSCHNF